MTIQRKQVEQYEYVISCDGFDCKETLRIPEPQRCHYGEPSIYSQAKKEALRQGWTARGRQCYCPKCSERRRGAIK